MNRERQPAAVTPARGATKDEVVRLNYDHHERMRAARERSWLRQKFIDARDRRLLARMLDLSGRGGRLLEVGCSGFRFGDYFRRRFGSVAGVDLHEPSVAAARARGFDARVCLAEDLLREFAPGSFDVILSRHVLEHTSEPDTVLRNIHALLAPEGTTAHAVPIPPYREEAHVTERTLEQWRSAFHAAGFHVLRAQRTSIWGKAENQIVARRA